MTTPAPATPDDKKKDGEWKKNPPHLDGVPDMSSLIYLEGNNVLHNLACRYKKNEIYTSISKVLIAINPYSRCVDYGGDLIERYRKSAASKRNQLPPHVFSVSQLAYYNLVKFKENQSMIVCGESGSGKTESAKHLMRYLAYTKATGDTKGISIEQQVLDANPILETFGNAKTILNWNSSRFGKFTKIVFGNEQDRIVGSFIETYLLEKSRVVQQELGERNYHCFYHICCPGVIDEAWYKDWSLTTADKFRYTCQGDAVVVKEVDDHERYGELKEAFRTLSFSDTEQKEMLQIVAAILHLGNVKFTPDKKDLAEVKEEGSVFAVQTAARLFGIEEKGLVDRLLTQSLKVSNQIIIKKLSVADANINRDAVAKALYHGLFLWTVSHINGSLYPVSARDPGLKWIGILDVFGFESFENNSFEQFCINFANERLQQYFNQHIIKSEQDLYRSESIMWTPIKVPDNQDVIDLIDGKQKGILLLLDNSAKMPSPSDQTFTRLLFQMNKYHPRMRQVQRIRNTKTNAIDAVNAFSIFHYAGTVVYNALEFLSKNMDQSSPDTIKLFCGSSGEVTKQILEDEDMKKAREELKKAEEAKAKGGPATGVKGKFSAFEPPKRPTASSSRPGGHAPESAFKSVGSYFSSQLEKLMTTLYQTTPFFVRCIKPNKKKIPADFDWEYVRPQLECGGIIEALRILKCGFPSRCTYDALFKRYGKILKPTPPNLNKRDFCEAVLRNAGETLDRAEFQLGLSRVFFRPGKQAFLEELLEGDSELPLEVVNRIKMFLLNKRLQRARGAVRVHIGFKLRLRQMRALIAVWKLFRLMRVIAATTFLRLHKVRVRIAAKTAQAFIRTHFMAAIQQKKKKAAMEIEYFYRHNKRRKMLNVELKKRIEVKRALLAEKDRLEKERQERERKDKDIMEAVEREKKRAHAEAEKARLAREAMEAELRAEQEKEALRLQKEKEEQERLARETEEKIRQAEMEAKQAKLDAAKMQKQMEEKLEEEKAAAESKIKALEERELGLNLREYELAEKEKKLAETKPTEAKRDLPDQMAHLVIRGTTFWRHGAALEEAGQVRVTLLENGVLRWVETDTMTDKGEPVQGDIKMENVLRIKMGAKHGQGEDNLFLVIESRNDSDETKTEFLELSAGTPEMRDKWVTALRYCWRNVKELGTISRPKKDLAYGNILAAMLTDELNEMKEKNKKVKQALQHSKAKLATVAAAPPVVTTTAVASPAMEEENKKLKQMVESLKKQAVLSQKQVEKLKRKTGLQQSSSTQYEELKNKNLILQDQVKDLKEQLNKFQDENRFLQQELEAQRVIAHADDQHAQKAREEQVKVELERKVYEARESVESAETKVIQAESAVRKRQDVIRKAMKELADRKSALGNTEQTMHSLGIAGQDPAALEDTTAKRLAELHTHQRQEQQEAEAILLKEYAAMVAEAESLNEMNEELARKTFAKEKHEALHKQVLEVQAKRAPPTATAQAGGSTRALPGVPGQPNGMGKGGGKDDGCVIS